MQLDNIRLLVSDFAGSFHFWHEIIGLKLIFKDDSGSVYAYFQAGSVRLELLRADYFAASLGDTQPVSAQEKYRGAIVFRVEDVDATYADLVERGATPLSPPQDRPQWYCRAAHLQAPDGYVVELFQNIVSVPWGAESAHS